MARNYNTSRSYTAKELKIRSFDMVLALTPVLVCAIWTHGAVALREIFLCVLATVMSQWLFRYFLKRPIDLDDGTAVVTGLLLACCLPPSVPVYIPILGGIFAQIMAVELFGGYGHNFVNPSLAAHGFLLVSFSTAMKANTVDAISVATPLADLAEGNAVNLMDMFLNKGFGAIGDISAICILIGFVYLVIRRRANVIIPVVGTAVFALCLGIFGGHGFDASYIGGEILGGAFLFLTCFIAVDPVVTPVKNSGKLVFGIVYGLLYAIYRVLGTSNESGTYALLFVMLLTPLLDMACTKLEQKKAAKSEGKEAA